MDYISLGCLCFGSILAIAYIAIFLIASSKYIEYVRPLDDKEHALKIMYTLGFFVLDKIKYKYSFKIDKLRRAQCDVLYGKNGEYYFRVNYAAKVGVSLIVLPCIFLAYAMMQTYIAFVVGALFIFLAVYNYDMKITDVTKVRSDEIQRDFPDILSKLTLLVNAGMIMNDAWRKVSETGTSTIYKEMQKVVIDVQNGVSDIQAYMNFGNRCLNDDVKKFSSTLVQNITKGNSELVSFLKEQNDFAWEERKHYARRKGEEASSKLMIPIIIMFAGVLIMILVPVFSNLSF